MKIESSLKGPENVRKSFKAIGTFQKGAKREAINILGCERRVHSSVILKRLSAAVSC